TKLIARISRQGRRALTQMIFKFERAKVVRRRLLRGAQNDIRVLIEKTAMGVLDEVRISEILS
ncbi:hypothetical protein, partial [Klebsiella pneumoniae]|uniref:hypothetical protein n=1 Tax=Klebsiella pneumoniae TaxID=573 RepID=UPI0019548087